MHPARIDAETDLTLSTNHLCMRENAEPYAPGETVYILRELRAGRQIYEIGSRARVRADRGSALVVHLDGSDADVVMCPSVDVARAAERVARMPVPRAA